ncbi:tyrosine-type recombinase/integrase [Gloeothece verrucosa]|uniref:Integrase family protein n=1 Tax=Gloeothece verrucosa (strain PCC 7822) TaxID=497965 RepID=E0UM84_GLOV7|nr:site-specific integrase [Gloeothece verrucosa]ADN18064.1 integrase family protein [Gloeothece verrucosa PCC 7822]
MTQLVERAAHPLQLSLPLPLTAHPVSVYLGTLRPNSVPIVRRHLDELAQILTDNQCDAMTLNWGQLRYQHTASLRAVLIQKYSPGTVNHKLCALRRVLREAKKLKLITLEDYSDAIEIDSVRNHQPSLKGRALSSLEIQVLFTHLLELSTISSFRDAALLAVLLGSGLRRAEVVSLDLADFNHSTGGIEVREGKGGKNRTVYLPDWGTSLVVQWLNLRGFRPGPLFYAVNKGQRIVKRRMSGQAVLYILQKRASDAGIEQVSPHDLRRTFISGLLDAGIDLVTVQKLAGHSDPATTARYDRRGEEAKRRAANTINAPF